MILRVCIVIPTYNNPGTIEKVVRDVLEETPYPVLVVDDGSDIPVQGLLANPSSRCHFLRLEKNSGKGVALQRAIERGLELGFTHLLSFDGDGQHLVSEIPKLVAAGKIHPWSLIIGARRLVAATVPGISKFGRAFSNYWVQFQTGTPISDSQSGLRLYPLFHLQNLRFWCRRYDFEIEVLIRLMWRAVEIHEVEIDVFYPEKSKRVSHFNKLWDNVRISVLNTLLVVLSLLNSRKSPLQIGLAVGTGVLIGCTPFFGFHTLMVAAVSFVFRLNAVFLWLGSQISLPPLAPFLIVAAFFLGHEIDPSLQENTFSWQQISHFSVTHLIEFAEAHFRAWLLGSLGVGLLLGTVIGTVAGWMSQRFQKSRPTKSTWNGRSRGGVIGNGFLKLVLRGLGIQAGYFCLLFVVPYFYLFAPRGRRALNEYWKQVEPLSSSGLRQWKIIKHFYRFGQILMDTVFQNLKTGVRFRTRPHGIEHILEASHHKKGLILLSAHVGAWSLASSLLESDGFKKHFYIVEYQARGTNFNQVLGPSKADHLKNFSMAQGGPSIFEIYEALGKGQTIGIMGDRPLAKRYELVSFFGKLALLDVTPFRLAVASGAPLLFSFGFKAEGQNYDFFASPAQFYQFQTNIDTRLQCLQWAQEFAHHLEQQVRRYPDQWFNFYPFWSSLPASPNEEKGSQEQNYLREELCK